MAYESRSITDRVASGDDCFYMETLPDGRVRLKPAPDAVHMTGTPVNKELLQLIEDRVVWLMNTVFNEISSNPFNVSFETLDGLTVEGVWNKAMLCIEC